MDNPRLPPYSPEAEQCALGSALISTHAAETLLVELERDDFHLDAHRKVFDVIAHLSIHERPVDLFSVAEELRRRSELERVGGPAALHDLTECVPTAAHVRFYTEIVREKATLRRLARAGEEIARSAYAQADPVEQIVSGAEALLYAAGRPGRSGTFVTAGDLAQRAAETLFGEPQPAGPRTGYGLLDYLTGGWKPGRLGILAGRPGSGKTAAMCNFAYNLACAGHPVGLFSTEMDRDELQTRLIAIAADVDSHMLQAQTLPDHLRLRAQRANIRLSELPLYVNDASDLTLLGLRGHARRLQRKRGVKLLIVDYLQRILPDGKGELDHRHFTRVAEGCKSMARELDCFVLALSQLSRGAEERKAGEVVPPPPQMRHLRESGGIEQAADLILMLHRRAYYGRQAGEEISGPDPTDVLVAKNRQGRTGSVGLLFHPESLRFEDPLFRPGDGDAPPASMDAAYGGLPEDR